MNPCIGIAMTRSQTISSIWRRQSYARPRGSSWSMSLRMNGLQSLRLWSHASGIFWVSMTRLCMLANASSGKLTRKHLKCSRNRTIFKEVSTRQWTLAYFLKTSWLVWWPSGRLGSARNMNGNCWGSAQSWIGMSLGQLANCWSILKRNTAQKA